MTSPTARATWAWTKPRSPAVSRKPPLSPGWTGPLLERSPFELSGGQKRRVAIAGVMAMEPRILVLDEPAAGLDPEGRDTILTQIKEYHRKTGVTVVLVSHSMEDIAKYADKVLVMHRAHVAMYDTVEKVFARAPGAARARPLSAAGHADLPAPQRDGP